jgi:hypothetical protein
MGLASRVLVLPNCESQHGVGDHSRSNRILLTGLMTWKHTRLDTDGSAGTRVLRSLMTESAPSARVARSLRGHAAQSAVDRPDDIPVVDVEPCMRI